MKTPPPRVKVACINWNLPDAPHAVSYVITGTHAIGDAYHPTWAEAMERANHLAPRLGLTPHELEEACS